MQHRNRWYGTLTAAVLTVALALCGCTASAGQEAPAEATALPAVTEPAESEATAEQEASALPEVQEGAEAEAETSAAPEGEAAAHRLPFSLTTLTGEPIDESYISGSKITMINYWATWCGPCVSEIPDLIEISEEYPAEEFRMLGVLLWDEDIQGAKQFIEEQGISYPVVNAEGVFLDMSAEFMGVPTTVFVNAEGNILGTVVGARSGSAWRELIDELLRVYG